jgi:hypothetical protein
MAPQAKAKESEVSGLEMKYFVLKPKGDDLYARASRAAMRQYAKLIQEDNATLANELREWADKEQIMTIAEDDKDEQQ